MIQRLLLLVLFGLVALPSIGQKPNILWLTIEDTSPQFVGCYGNKIARTAVMDRLAREGVRFTNAFSTGTVCSPSRTALITGIPTYKTGTGNHRSQYPLPEFVKGFPWYLKQQGYYVTNNSKTDYNVTGEKEFIRTTWHESSDRAGWWNRQPGQPFFAVFNFMDSHQSRTMTQPYEWYEEQVLKQLTPEERIGEDKVELPPFYNDSREMRRQVTRVYNALKLTDNRLGQLLDRLDRDRLMDSTIIFFFADHGEGIPRGKTNGINLGYRVPFVIWFPPMYAHLSPWGQRVVSDELISFEDLAPTLISLAGGQVPAHLSGRILLGPKRSRLTRNLFLATDRFDNGIDMVRTVTDGRYLYSRNFMPYMPQLRYIRYMEIGEIKQQMRKELKAKQLNTLQKSLFEERPAEFLFDLEKDPWETQNLADDPRMLPILNQKRRALDQHLLSTRDVHFLPEFELSQLASSITPYDFRLNPKKYPFELIYRVAALSGKRSKGIAAQQIQFLHNPNSIVRFWAMTGLRSQKKGILSPYHAQLQQAMKDPYPPVAIMASTLCFELFNSPEGEANLKRACQSSNLHLALMAINQLLYLQHPEPFIDTILQVKAKPALDYNVSAACKDFLGKLGLLPNNFANQ